MASNRDPLAAERLDSWKEIAVFFGRAERTVKRWETERGLPVHRVPGSGRAAVFAYSHELSEWLKGRSAELDSSDLPSTGQQESERSPAGPTETPVQKRADFRAVASWLVPFGLVVVLTFLFSFGHRGLTFKAVAARHIPNPEAQELYLKGRYYWDRRTPDDLNKAVDYFTQAIVKDPSDAQAYVGLADCYNLLREFGSMPPAEAFPRALAAAQRAVELDDTSAEAHNSLAFGTFWWSWQAATAEREFRRALDLDPNFVRAHHWYGTFLMALHRFPEALDQLEQARRLDPGSKAIVADQALLLSLAGRKSDALALLQQLEASEPAFSSAHDYLGRMYWDQKDYPNALREWREMSRLRRDMAGLEIAEAREKGYAAGKLPGLWKAELPVQADLLDHGAGSAYRVAELYAALGNLQQAEIYLQRAFDRRDSELLSDDPNLAIIQDDPVYRELRAKVQARLQE
jgi:tetratricopeptide (TPR) repeat protein